MCPMCIATAAWIALGAGAGGGAATLLTLKLRRQKTKATAPPASDPVLLPEPR